MGSPDRINQEGINGQKVILDILFYGWDSWDLWVTGVPIQPLAVSPFRPVAVSPYFR